MAPLECTIEKITDPSAFPAYVNVEIAAFGSRSTMQIIYPPSKVTPEAIHAFQVSLHTTNLKEDPSVIYLAAKLPSGLTIGIAKWNFFTSPAPHFPWQKTYIPGSNSALIASRFGRLDAARNAYFEREKPEKCALMAVLAIDPEYQRMGIGGALLEWGLRRCDEEGWLCWIDASPAGRGLYLKNGWVEIGSVETDMGFYGGKEGVVERIVSLIREPKKRESV